LSSIEIREVATRGDLDKFIKFPLNLYSNEPHYVPHLIADRKKFFDKKKNPFFKHARVAFYLAFKDERPVGRIAGIVNHLHNEYHHEKTGFFGFFDCIDDLEVASALFKAAEDFVRQHGMQVIRGPANFSSNDEMGLLVEGFDALPTFMMLYNPPYHLDLYQKLGLEKVEDLMGYYIDEKNAPSERIQRIVEKLRTRNRIRIRKVNMGDFENELEIIRTIYNSAWSKNWGFVPMTPDEFAGTADDFRKIVDPDLVFLAFVDNEPAGFSLALPDYNPVFKKMNGRLFPLGIFKFLYYTRIKRLITGLRMITMGVVHKYQKIGLDMIFFVDTYNEGLRKGYKWAELSWILERNTLMNKGAMNMGARLYKRYRMFEKPL
jgi:hypothetical protein